MRPICIFGMGSIGGLIGLFLARAGLSVFGVVRREEQAERLSREGMKVSGLLEGSYELQADTRPPPEGCAYSLITTKAYDAPLAIASAAPVSSTLVTFSNGLLAFERALEVKRATVGGIVEYGVVRRGDNHVEVRGVGRLLLGRARSSTVDPAPFAEVLRRGGAIVEVVDRIESWLWLKLAANAIINPITALVSSENYVVLEPMLRPLVECVAEEVRMVAQASGVELPEDPVEYTLRIAERTRNNRSSMLQDLESGRRTEIEEINGYVVQVASRLGVEARCNRTLLMLLKAVEYYKASRRRSGGS
ncbi:MAG: 2-dehydropantoate 2-reductase [Acidilobaceae archaeon]|nr:2-dehydropantoate 2-reductase [Acidilobaceae archaeon]MCX8165575.1 2-dehydropantoate 2-reductase [Acidilobaceae archaeon]MDW7974002.1 2-dehydropantoate 2-reductase [Sulfolobales archaeon]